MNGEAGEADEVGWHVRAGTAQAQVQAQVRGSGQLGIGIGTGQDWAWGMSDVLVVVGWLAIYLRVDNAVYRLFTRLSVHPAR